MMVDLDTPYHDDHVRDNVLTAGCQRCAPFMREPFLRAPDRWEEHRARLLPPLWGPGGPAVGQVIVIASTSIRTRWTGTHWELVDG